MADPLFYPWDKYRYLKRPGKMDPRIDVPRVDPSASAEDVRATLRRPKTDRGMASALFGPSAAADLDDDVGPGAAAQRRYDDSILGRGHDDEHWSEEEDGEPGPRISANIGPGLWVRSGYWVQVASSNVTAIRYDLEGEKLYVEFYGSKRRASGMFPTYEYYKVPKSVAVQCYYGQWGGDGSSSVGKFVKHILERGGYSWRKIRG